MSSTSLDYPVSSLQENPRPNGQVLTPRRGGHDIPSAVRLPDHRWRHDLALGLEVQGRESAHPSTATRHRACHAVGPVTPIRVESPNDDRRPTTFVILLLRNTWAPGGRGRRRKGAQWTAPTALSRSRLTFSGRRQERRTESVAWRRSLSWLRLGSASSTSKVARA